MGAAGGVVEDQVWPKGGGDTGVKAGGPREEAVGRVRAAGDARDEHGGGLVVIARTDANACLGFDEALKICNLFPPENNAVADVRAEIEAAQPKPRLVAQKESNAPDGTP